MTSCLKFRPTCESLGERTLPAVTLSNGLLEVVGTTESEFTRVFLGTPGTLRVTVDRTGEDFTFPIAAVNNILLRARAGDDVIVIGPNITIPGEIRAWAGNDRVLGGGGNDVLLGGGGDDVVDGRGGNDTIIGQHGNDDLFGDIGDDTIFGDFPGNTQVGGDDRCRGGTGRDSFDGGPGRDSFDDREGDEDVRDAFDRDNELFATFTGGQGKAEFKFGPDNGFIEREFEVEVEDLTPNGTAEVFVDGVSVGVIQLDAFGDGKLKFELDFDSDNDGAVDFPPNFPEISAGSVVTVVHNGATVREGVFVLVPNDVGGNSGGGGNSGSGGSGNTGGGTNGGGGGTGNQNDTLLLAPFTGGEGKAKFQTGFDDGLLDREFEAEVEDLTPNGTAEVLVDGVSVGLIQLDGFGDGELDYDNNFPPNFPDIAPGSQVSVIHNGVTVRLGTFVVSGN